MEPANVMISRASYYYGLLCSVVLISLLSTLYVNLPHHKTKASHRRRQGQGQDIQVAKQSTVSFPKELAKYKWGVNLIPEKEPTNLKTKDHGAWTIVLSVNLGFFDFFENWWAFYTRLDLEYPVLIYAEDAEVYDRLLKKTAKFSGVRVERSELNISKAATYKTKAYNAIVSTHAKRKLEPLQLGRDII